MKATLDRVDLQRSVTQLKSMTGKGVLGVTGNERGVELTTYSTDADMSVVATVPGDVEPSDAVALATLDLAMKVVKGMPKGEITVEQIGTDTKPSVQFAVGDAESVILSPDPNNYETRRSSSTKFPRGKATRCRAAKSWTRWRTFSGPCLPTRAERRYAKCCSRPTRPACVNVLKGVTWSARTAAREGSASAART